MLDLGARPSSDVAQQTCSQLRPRSSRCVTSCGFSLSPASTAFQSKALTSGSMEVLDTISLDSTGDSGEPHCFTRINITPTILQNSLRICVGGCEIAKR